MSAEALKKEGLVFAPSNKRLKDRTGDKHGSWTALGYAGNLHWWSECECGTLRKMSTKAIKKGIRLTCSRCYQDGENTVSALGKRLHLVWAGMLSRCRNPRNRRYDRYGGRGVRVCDEWSGSFIAFAKWAKANGYQDHLTIERKNNDGDYTPDNCTWIPRSDQAKNRSGLVMVRSGDESICMAEYARRQGANPDLVGQRVRNGWSAERAVGVPPRPLKRRHAIRC